MHQLFEVPPPSKDQNNIAKCPFCGHVPTRLVDGCIMHDAFLQGCPMDGRIIDENKWRMRI
jgi:hypothetical protein